METKKCKKCGSVKPISRYLTRKETGKLRNECNDCMNAYHREVYLRKVGKFKLDVKAEKREASEKSCIHCGVVKPIGEFGWHNVAKKQHRNFCKQCQKEWDSKYKTSPEGKQKTTEWINRNKDKIVAYRELYKADLNNVARHKEYSRKAILKRFGITQEDYDRMFQMQEGKCKICGTQEINRDKKYFCVDHNHETGEVRGLLCHNCNVAIGLMKDSPELLNKAINYLTSI